MLILMTYVSLFPYTGSGPMWKKDGMEVNYCKNSWWYNFLYINNFVSITDPEKQVSNRNRKKKGIKKIELKSSNIQTILTFKTVLVHQLNYIFLWIFFTCISHDHIFHHFCKNDQKGVFFLVERKREITVINMALLSLLTIYVTMCIYLNAFTA